MGGGFEVLFFLVFFVILGFFICMAVKGIIQWNKNNNSPRLTVDALITGKRISVTHHHNNDAVTSSTAYYVTFQVGSGDRMELTVGGSDYGLLAEGDRGKLSFQGTRFLGFERL